MTQKDWNPVLNTCEDKFQLFITELKQGIDRYLPQRTVKVHQTDRPWIRDVRYEKIPEKIYR